MHSKLLSQFFLLLSTRLWSLCSSKEALEEEMMELMVMTWEEKYIRGWLESCLRKSKKHTTVYCIWQVPHPTPKCHPFEGQKGLKINTMSPGNRFMAHPSHLWCKSHTCTLYPQENSSQQTCVSSVLAALTEAT